VCTRFLLLSHVEGRFQALYFCIFKEQGHVFVVCAAVGYVVYQSMQQLLAR
jgi:hypothetical protein